MATFLFSLSLLICAVSKQQMDDFFHYTASRTLKKESCEQGGFVVIVNYFLKSVSRDHCFVRAVTQTNLLVALICYLGS